MDMHWYDDITAKSHNLFSIPSCFLISVRTTISPIGMLLKAGPADWIVQETKEIAEMNFRFVDKIDAASYTTRLANSMQNTSPEHIVRVSPAVVLSCCDWEEEKYCVCTATLYVIISSFQAKNAWQTLVPVHFCEGFERNCIILHLFISSHIALPNVR